VKKNLTILLVLACGLGFDISQAQTQKMDELWFSAAGKALTKNESALSFVPMSAVLGERGYLETFRKRGHEILAPGGIDQP
jgi:hypothetical protein